MTSDHQSRHLSHHDSEHTDPNARAAAIVPPEQNAWTEDRMREVLEAHESGLVRYATRLLAGDSERAREVVQDTLLKLCRTRPIDVEGHLTEWLFTVCRNRALDVARKERRMSPFTDQKSAASDRSMDDLIAAPAGHGSSPGNLQMINRIGPRAEATVEREEHHRMRSLLDSLSPNQQEVIRLKFQGGLTYRQIANVTQLSVSNVGFLIHTGLKRLREQTHAPAATPTGTHSADHFPG